MIDRCGSFAAWCGLDAERKARLKEDLLQYHIAKQEKRKAAEEAKAKLGTAPSIQSISDWRERTRATK